MTNAPASHQSLLRRYATPLTLCLSLVMGVTGIMLFFHLTPGPTRAIHEWLGLGFVMAAMAHGWRHGSTMLFWLKQKRTYGVALACGAVLAAFAILPPGKPSPMGQLLRRVEQVPLATLAPVLGVDSETLVHHLQTHGHAGADPAQSLGTLARQSGQPVMQVLGQTMAVTALTPANPATPVPSGAPGR